MRNNNSQHPQRGQGNTHQRQGQGGHQMQGRGPPQNREQNSWNPENRPYGQQRQNQLGWGNQGFGWGEEAPRGFGQEREGQFDQQWRGDDEGFHPDDSGRAQHGFGPQQQPQQRFGKGPKGYKRSDERIKEDASDRISQMGHVDASEVELEVKAGEVTLTGTVPSRTMKWQLENLVESVGGVTDVNNQLRIKREELSGSKPTDGMSGSSQGQHK